MYRPPFLILEWLPVVENWIRKDLLYVYFTLFLARIDYMLTSVSCQLYPLVPELSRHVIRQQDRPIRYLWLFFLTAAVIFFKHLTKLVRLLL